MAEHYDTLWSLVRTWKGNPRPAFSYDDGGETPATLSYDAFFDLVTKTAADTKPQDIPIAFPCVRTPENLAVLLGTLLGGNDLIMIDESGTPPDGFLLAPVEKGPAPIPGSTFTEGVAEGHALFFTSGTTSSSKAVILSTRALLAACANGQALAATGPDDVLLAILPLSHVFGFICSFLWGLTYGSCIALGRSLREIFLDPGYFKPTVLSAVPAMIDVLVRGNCLNPELRLVIIGAAPARAKTITQLKEQGIEAHLGYGLTETASGIALHTDDPDPLALTPCPDAEITIEEDGEISVATPSLMDGYLNADTKEAVHDGRFFTGDVGFFDEVGNLHVTGRKKDVIVLPNGTKIFLPEYESDLTDQTRIEDLAVCEIDDSLILFIGTPLPDGVDKDSINSAVDRYNLRLPRDHQIGDIVIWPRPLPRTNTGKVMRYLLQKPAKE